MYAFRRNATFTTTNNLVSCRHFFSCGGNSERNVESLIIILPYSSLASLRPPSFGSLTRLLCSYLTDTWSNNFGTSWGYVWSYNTTLRQLLEIGDWTTWVWCVIHVYRLRLICSLIFECPFLFVFFVQGLLHTFMDLRFDFAATNRRFAVLGWTSKMFVNKHSDLLALGF